MPVKKGAHTRWDCRYHLVWCPKYRKDLFADESLRRHCRKLFEDIAAKYECELEAAEIAADHVHLLLSIQPKLSVADLARTFKIIRARDILKKYPAVKERLWGGALWKEGYFVKSVGSGTTEEKVREYIETHKIREDNSVRYK